MKTQHVTKNRGRYCGDIDRTTFLDNTTGPVPLVLDLLISHDRFGSSCDLNLNGHLHYPNDIDRSLNETTDKIRKYRSDYNNNPPNVTSFMSVIVSTSGRLHSEFVRLLFLRPIGKLTTFLQLQEFILRILPVDSSTSTVRLPPLNLKEGSVTSFLWLQLYVLRLI
jgi:hypothetical protein